MYNNHMGQKIFTFISVIGIVLFLLVVGCENPKDSKSPAPGGTPPGDIDITENIETTITIDANGIETLTFVPAVSGAYVLYILDVNDTYSYKCDFTPAGEKGDRTGKNYCLFSSLTGGAEYDVSLESYASQESNLTLLLVSGDVTETTLQSPLNLELNTSSTSTRLGAYRDTGYFSFTTSDISNDIRVYVQKGGVPLSMELFTGSNFSGSVYSWIIPNETTDTVAPVTDLDMNTTYYMTARNGGTTYTDLVVKVDHYPADENQTVTPTPSNLSVGVQYDDLVLTDRKNRYDFVATSEEHNITLVSDALLWTLYAPVSGSYETYFRCWSSSDRKTKCTVYNLTVGTIYRLYVGCFFAPECTTEHSLLIE